MGQYFDPVGVTEDNTTVYTLKVCVPRRPSPWRNLKGLINSKSSIRSPEMDNSQLLSIEPDTEQSTYSGFDSRHLKDMETKDIEIQSKWFDAEYRCEHVQGGSTKCDQLCYVLEEKADPNGLTVHHHCKRIANPGCKGCQGHAYCGPVKAGQYGECFGEPGKRLVAIEQ